MRRSDAISLPFSIARHVLHAGLLLLAGLAAGGCFVVYDPGEEIETPAVSGTLRAAGLAKPSVELWISPVHGRGQCDGLAFSTRSLADGTFEFPETRAPRTFEFVPLAPSTPAYTIEVCVDRGSGPEPLYAETFVGSLPLQVILDCDLERMSSGREPCEVTRVGRQTPGYQGID